MDRARDLSRWPHADRSHFIRCRPHDWHVQEMGEGPTILFLHGSGASTHSWRDVLPLLTSHWRCIAVDLPGQGFTTAGTLSRCGLDPMTEDIAALCEHEGWRPSAIVGHSAGAAIALNLALSYPEIAAVVGINAALGHFEGVASVLFPLLARLLAMNPLTATLFTLGGPNLPRARRIIQGTGSTIDGEGLDCYATLIGDRHHVDATLQMMTQWRIDVLLDRLPEVKARTLFITGKNDRAVPPETSQTAARRMADAEVVQFPEVGHLAHEEAPEEMATCIDRFLGSVISERTREPRP